MSTKHASSANAIQGGLIRVETCSRAKRENENTKARQRLKSIRQYPRLGLAVKQHWIRKWNLWPEAMHNERETLCCQLCCTL
jgi:hypothetical protein